MDIGPLTARMFVLLVGREVATFQFRRRAAEEVCWWVAIYRKEGRRWPAVGMLTEKYLRVEITKLMLNKGGRSSASVLNNLEKKPINTWKVGFDGSK